MLSYDITMGIKIIFTLYLVTVISAAVNHPKVYEELDELEKGNVRNVRNLESERRVYYNPPVFNYQRAVQQDQRKQRYVQQQQFDISNLIRRTKAQQYLVPSIQSDVTSQYFGNQKIRDKDSDIWQPFEPKITHEAITGFNSRLHLSKENINDKSNFDHFFNGALKDSVWDVNSYESKNGKLSTESDDLDIAGSEISEDKVKINRQDTPYGYKNIVYVHPNLLREQHNKNIHQAKQNEKGADQASTPQRSENQLNILNDLIGKNPNIQLDGLKRLLQDTPIKNYILPPITRQQTQSSDHIPISENAPDIQTPQTRPNIQVNHPDGLIPASLPIVTKDALANIQKQLDDASRIQVEKALAEARQQAQAEVEAQHKVIALARAQAEKDVLENVHQTLYGNSPMQIQTYQPQVKTIIYTPEKESEEAKQYSNHIQNTETEEEQPISTKLQQQTAGYPLQPTTPTKILAEPLIRAVPVPNYSKVIPLYGLKNSPYYAPSHRHQALAQLQAQKALAAQVKAQNDAVLQSHKNSPAAAEESFESQEQQITHDDVENEPHAEDDTSASDAYKHIILESKQTENIQKIYTRAEPDEEDDQEDQYASKYAFGYRIKDAKEGSDFGHEEKRNGKSAQGSYHVLLPDGRIQKVEYYADKSGYHARVSYQNIAHHPTVP